MQWQALALNELKDLFDFENDLTPTAFLKSFESVHALIFEYLILGYSEESLNSFDPDREVSDGLAAIKEFFDKAAILTENSGAIDLENLQKPILKPLMKLIEGQSHDTLIKVVRSLSGFVLFVETLRNELSGQLTISEVALVCDFLDFLKSLKGSDYKLDFKKPPLNSPKALQDLTSWAVAPQLMDSLDETVRCLAYQLITESPNSLTKGYFSADGAIALWYLQEFVVGLEKTLPQYSEAS